MFGNESTRPAGSAPNVCEDDTVRRRQAGPDPGAAPTVIRGTGVHDTVGAVGSPPPRLHAVRGRRVRRQRAPLPSPVVRRPASSVRSTSDAEHDQVRERVDRDHLARRRDDDRRAGTRIGARHRPDRRPARHGGFDRPRPALGLLAHVRSIEPAVGPSRLPRPGPSGRASTNTRPRSARGRSPTTRPPTAPSRYVSAQRPARRVHHRVDVDRLGHDHDRDGQRASSTPSQPATPAVCSRAPQISMRSCP